MAQIILNPQELHPPKTPRGFGADIEAVEAWIANLPLANVDETCRLVFNFLVELNTKELPLQQRFKVLELFRRPNQYLSDALKRHFVGAPFPLSGKANKAAAQPAPGFYAAGHQPAPRPVLSRPRPVDHLPNVPARPPRLMAQHPPPL